MSARILILTSKNNGEGKTHVAAGLARWLYRSGYRVAPLHLSRAVGDPVACPEGGAVSRAAALLAEASGLAPAPEYESGEDGLSALAERFEVVLVETAAGTAPPAGLPAATVHRTSQGVELAGLGALPLFDTDLMPENGAEVDALPLWTLGTGPRAGIVSLPHISNFPDYQLLRGAEWLTMPAPGRFAYIFIPASTNPEEDSAWIREAGLEEWMAAQRAGGCRTVGSGWSFNGAERVEPGDLLDHRNLSLILGRRVPPQLPDEATLDRLGGWMGAWPGLAAFVRRFLPS